VNQSCPECRTARPDAARYCPSCHYDFESFTARYRGTGGGSLPVADSLMMPPPTRHWQRALLRLASFFVGLLLVVIAVGISIRSGLVPQIEFPLEVVAVMAVLTPLAGGLASLIVPGRFARGPFKSFILGQLGWLPLVVLVFVLTGWLPGSIGHLSGAMEHMLVSIVGASLIRLFLLIVFD
jgi:uncharacterized membrane protein YeaQ/YmgE (transglycosylase-associated protein family)